MRQLHERYLCFHDKILNDSVKVLINVHGRLELDVLSARLVCRIIDPHLRFVFTYINTSLLTGYYYCWFNILLSG